jgi:hypothetical protein
VISGVDTVDVLPGLKEAHIIINNGKWHLDFGRGVTSVEKNMCYNLVRERMKNTRWTEMGK